MDFSKIKLFHLLKTDMSYLAERQDVLAGNIARADIPGERAEDLKPLNFERLADAEYHRLEMRATSPHHMPPPGGIPKEFRAEKQRKTYETTPEKNSIVIEEQMGKIAQNNAEYSKITSLYKKYTDFFKIAIGKNVN